MISFATGSATIRQIVACWLLCGFPLLVAGEATAQVIDEESLVLQWVRGDNPAVINAVKAMPTGKQTPKSVIALYLMAMAETLDPKTVRNELKPIRTKLLASSSKANAWQDIVEGVVLRVEGKLVESSILAQTVFQQNQNLEFGVPSGVALARALEVMGRHSDAIEIYERVIRLEKTANSSEHPVSALVSKRIKEIRTAVKNRESPDEFVFQRGMREYQAAQYPESYASFASLPQRFPASSRVNEAGYWAGMALFKSKSFAEAIAHFEAYLEQDAVAPFRGQARIALFDHYLEDKLDLDQALSQVAAVKQGSDTTWRQAAPQLAMRHALGLYLLDKTEEAQAVLSALSAEQKAGQTTSGPNGWLPPPTPASLLLERISKGTPLLGSVRMSQIKRVNVLTALSEAYWLMQQYEKSAALIGTVLSEFEPGKLPKNIHAHLLFRQADCVYWQGDYKRTLSLYDRFVEAYPKGDFTPEVLLRIGVLQYTRFQDAHSALASFALLEKRFPTHELASSAGVYSALCHLWTGNEKQCVATLSRVKRQYPQSEWARVSIEEFVKQASLAPAQSPGQP